MNTYRALKRDVTRHGKRTHKGALDDGINSLLRYYINNVKDKSRQLGLDFLLGVWGKEESSLDKAIHSVEGSIEVEDVDVDVEENDVNGSEECSRIEIRINKEIDETGSANDSFPDSDIINTATINPNTNTTTTTSTTPLSSHSLVTMYKHLEAAFEKQNIELEKMLQEFIVDVEDDRNKIRSDVTPVEVKKPKGKGRLFRNRFVSPLNNMKVENSNITSAEYMSSTLDTDTAIQTAKGSLLINQKNETVVSNHDSNMSTVIVEFVKNHRVFLGLLYMFYLYIFLFKKGYVKFDIIDTMLGKL